MSLARILFLIHPLSLDFCHFLQFSLTRIPLDHRYYLVSPVYDTLTIDIEMEDTMPGFVFALLPKKSEKEMRRLNADLRHYASRVKDLSAAVASAGRKGTQPNLDKVGAKACVLTDCPELVAYFLPPDVQAALVKGSQYFQLLHFTDQNCCHGVGRFGDGSAGANFFSSLHHRILADFILLLIGEDA